MFKRILALTLALLLCFLAVGCGQKPEDNSSIEETSSEKPTVAINTLTGEEMDLALEKNRPVAVMINNIATAQAVQTGLNSFDILYETEVEGGITRMMGVTKNIAAMPQIGTVRSARYVYLDLALGHDAVYVHGGFDPIYFAAHKKELGVTTIDINSTDSKYGFRQSNGLSSEHTLYTTGEKLSAAIDNRELSRETEKNTWITFAEETRKPSADCLSVTVPFSSSYVTGFTYEESSGKYIKNFRGTEKTDYLTNEKLRVTNIFVLFTTIKPYADNKHMEVALTGGTGYYVSAGGYEEIKWSKGSANSALSFTKADGSEFTANVGNSYICLVDGGQEAKVKFLATAE